MDQGGTTVLYISSITAKHICLTHCKLIINDVEIIACKIDLFKHPIIDFIIQEISAERERSLTLLLQLCLRHKKTKLRSVPIWNPSLNISPAKFEPTP